MLCRRPILDYAVLFLTQVAFILLMVLGLVKGYSDPKAAETKAAYYALVQEFAARFKAQFGTIICRELLANVETVPGPAPEARTPAYYDHRPCAKFVKAAAEILDSML